MKRNYQAGEPIRGSSRPGRDSSHLQTGDLDSAAIAERNRRQHEARLHAHAERIAREERELAARRWR